MARVFNQLDWVWVKDEEEMVLPAQVKTTFEEGNPGQVMVRRLIKQVGAPPAVTDTPLLLTAKQTKTLERMDPKSLEPIENMVNLPRLSESSILHNLRLRFAEDQIYTSVGSILVSVNPFKLLPLYTSEVLESYKEHGFRDQPPHVYGIADMAYANMTSSGKDQSCIVSGESGAGKTEATKIFLQYIAEVSQKDKQSKKTSNIEQDTLLKSVKRSTMRLRKKSKSDEDPTLQEQILKANPLMEAFGNAKTVRNNNSSRFGKWIEVQFNNKKGSIVGGRIIQYLLEKSRIVAQQPNERNYHIFYNLCAGALMDDSVRKKFRLGDPRDYNYLNQNQTDDSMTVEGINDERDWEDVLNSMAIMGISTSEQDDILRTLAGILHLGNIEFDEVKDAQAGSKVSNEMMLQLAANQLGTAGKQLEAALCTRQIHTVAETTQKRLNVAEAVDTRDALAKALYAQMFEWLINRINKSLAGNKTPKEDSEKESGVISIIGVLDIFGFEVFEFNSFEQLCINYCNEKLQFHFNNHIFKIEEALYRTEGIDVSSIKFKDNVPTLQLFEKKKTGIFAVLDEEMFLPHGKDSSFLTKVSKTNGKHPNFRKPGVKTTYERNSFSVIHYAGMVMYNVNGFLDKNSDKLSPDLLELITNSSISYVSKLIPPVPIDKTLPGGRKTKRIQKRNKGASLGTKFKNQLNILMSKLQETEPQFIRCVKPNNEKVGDMFGSDLILEQLRYAGLLEVCKIRKVGFPIRRDFQDFIFRYSCLVDEIIDRKGNSAAEVNKLASILSKPPVALLEAGEYQVGKTIVFMRDEQVNRLEAQREGALTKHAVLLQSVIRGHIERKKYKGYMAIRERLRHYVAKKDLPKIKQSITDHGELPFQGRNLKELRDARTLVEKMEEILRVITLLHTAAEKNDINLLMSATAAEETMQKVPGFQQAELATANKAAHEALDKLQTQKKAIEALKAAMNERNLPKLAGCLQELLDMGLKDVQEFHQGEVLRAKLEEEERVLRNIDRAVKERNRKRLQDALAAANEMGLDSSNPLVKQGEDVLESLLKEETEKEQKIQREKAEKLKEENRLRVEKKLKEIKDKLVDLVKTQNFDKVFELKTQALDLGMNKADLDAILSEVESLEKIKDNVNALAAAMGTLKTIALNKNGISHQDINYLSELLDKARENGLTEDNRTLNAAIKLEEAMHKQLEIQVALQQATSAKRTDFAELKLTIEKADELNLDLEVLNTARELLKQQAMVAEKELKLREQQVRESRRINAENVTEDQFEQQRRKNIEIASQNKFHFAKYYKIRTNGDYVRGIIFNKRKIAESQLHHQTTVIPKSILTLPKDLNKLALGINKSILGYCGELAMQFPATLAKDILEKGLQVPDLVDEIYIQICKHLSNNRKPESVTRAWQLMCLSVGTFAPSSEFEYYLSNFLIANQKAPGVIGNYAIYSMRRLEGMLIRGPAGFLPTLEEILAYKKRPPVLSTIELVDGTPLTEDLPVPPDLNVDRVLEICMHFLKLTDDRRTQFGIYVQEDPIDDFMPGDLPQSAYSAMRLGADQDDPEMPPLPPPPPESDEISPPPETPHPLRGKDFLGDVVLATSRKNVRFTFVFKKKLFVPKLDKVPSKDEVYKRLMYLQSADEVIRGNVLVEKESTLLYLTAIALKNDIQYQNGVPGSAQFPHSEAKLLELDLMQYIPAAWTKKKTPKNWASAVATQRGKVIQKSNPQLEEIYVHIVQDLPLWGLNFFFVREKKHGNDVICGVGYGGLSFFSLRRKQLKTYTFTEIDKWGGSSSQFWLLLWNTKTKQKMKVTLYTTQAKDISNLILDYAKLRKSKNIIVGY